MTKIMLVEDDKSLREIYGVRLLAEGYDIVSAGDGEMALAMAIKERPHLIISDIMMPKISGFDLLDILRSTTETRDTKGIMMTALSSEDQRLRGEQLGADKYLVKSQVGIEDVVRVVHEVLGDGAQSAATPAVSAAQQPQSQAQSQPQSQPQDQPQSTPANPQPTATQQSQTQAAPQAPSAPEPPQQTKQASSTPEPAQNKSRVITPLNDPNDAKVDLNDLLDKELAREAGMAENARPTVSTTEQERAAMKQQLDAFTPEDTSQDEAELDTMLHPATADTDSEEASLPKPNMASSGNTSTSTQTEEEQPSPQTSAPQPAPAPPAPQQPSETQQSQPSQQPQAPAQTDSTQQTQQPAPQPDPSTPQQPSQPQATPPPSVPTPPPNTMPTPTQFQSNG